MLFVKNTPINQILSMTEMIEVIEDTLKEVALGRGFDLPRRRIHHPNRMIFGLLPGSVHGAMGAYLQTDLDRRIHHETVILYDTETGEPLILFQDCSINESRTGAAGGLGPLQVELRRVADAVQQDAPGGRLGVGRGGEREGVGWLRHGRSSVAG